MSLNLRKSQENKQDRLQLQVMNNTDIMVKILFQYNFSSLLSKDNNVSRWLQWQQHLIKCGLNFSSSNVQGI